jgi:hypothetical protein
VSAIYISLILNKPDTMKYLMQEQNKLIPSKFTGNVHLFECLVDVKHAGVKTDSRDDVVVTDRSVWRMNWRGGTWETISEGDCGALSRLLCVGLDVNQSIQCSDNKSDVRPLLNTLIEKGYVNDRTEKVRILLEIGADVNVRVRYTEYCSVLDREGVSVLERMRRLVCKYSDRENWWNSRDREEEYKRVMSAIKKHVRRHSI